MACDAWNILWFVVIYHADRTARGDARSKQTPAWSHHNPTWRTQSWWSSNGPCPDTTTQTQNSWSVILKRAFQVSPAVLFPHRRPKSYLKISCPPKRCFGVATPKSEWPRVHSTWATPEFSATKTARTLGKMELRAFCPEWNGKGVVCL